MRGPINSQSLLESLTQRKFKLEEELDKVRNLIKTLESQPEVLKALETLRQLGKLEFKE